MSSGITGLSPPGQGTGIAAPAGPSTGAGLGAAARPVTGSVRGRSAETATPRLGPIVSPSSSADAGRCDSPGQDRLTVSVLTVLIGLWTLVAYGHMG
ncbi:predicted protein [Streptomyces iranensis]|uniref:Uncharacterized protein n=1 Tax=Streptomyces iranensis TaxID=576784 RepID=A0A060ZFX5_9ACTN|nr:predicted protein [Streptomyces iranensis]